MTARDKFDEWIGEARSAASEVAQTAKDTASDSTRSLELEPWEVEAASAATISTSKPASKPAAPRG